MVGAALVAARAELGGTPTSLRHFYDELFLPLPVMHLHGYWAGQPLKGARYELK